MQLPEIGKLKLDPTSTSVSAKGLHTDQSLLTPTASRREEACRRDVVLETNRGDMNCGRPLPGLPLPPFRGRRFSINRAELPPSPRRTRRRRKPGPTQ